jgi:hypothetical protein
MVQISVPPQTAEKLRRSAELQGIETSELLVRLVEQYLAEDTPQPPAGIQSTHLEQQAKIDQEQRHYEAQHAVLKTTYDGQYIAMHDGQVVDHDVARVALSRRIRKQYGKTAVLITRVSDEPKMTIHIVTPLRRGIAI